MINIIEQSLSKCFKTVEGKEKLVCPTCGQYRCTFQGFPDAYPENNGDIIVAIAVRGECEHEWYLVLKWSKGVVYSHVEFEEPVLP